MSAAVASAPFATSRPTRTSSKRASSARSRRARAARASSSSSSSTSAGETISGVGFSAAGFFFPYHLGVWETLVELGVMRSGETPCAGSSAGSLVAALHACGKTPADGERILRDVLRDCREKGVVGRVGGVLERVLRRELPSDAHVRCSRGNLFISVSSPKWTSDEKGGSSFILEGEIISRFDSYDDLIGAILASCHIPLYCGWAWRNYRDRPCVDGGWYDLAPRPLVDGRHLRVCAFPLLDAWYKAQPGDGKESGDVFAQQASFWSGWGDDDKRGLLVAPDSAGGSVDWDFKDIGVMKYAFLPGDDQKLEEMVAMGREDARRWAMSAGYAQKTTLASSTNF